MNRENEFDESGSSPPGATTRRGQTAAGLTSGREGDLMQNQEPSCGDRVLLRANEAAKMLALGRSKVYEMLKRNEMPVVRVGAAVRVPCEALVEWVRAMTRRAA